MLKEFLLFSNTIIIFLIIWFLGTLIKSLFVNSSQKNTFGNTFNILFLGLFCLVFIVSVWFTKGITVFFILPFFGIGYIKSEEIRLQFPNKCFLNLWFNFKAFLPCCLLLLCFFSLDFFFIYSTETNEFLTPGFDFLFYSGIGGSLTEYGVENKDMVLNGLYPKEFFGVTPYHYFELWLCGFSAWIFKISPVKALMLVVFPLLKTTVCIGVLSLTEELKINTGLRYLLGILLLGVSGVYFPFFDSFEITRYYIGYTQSGVLTFGLKYLPIYLISLKALRAFLSGKFEKSLIFLLLAPLVSIGTAPGILSVVFLFSLYFAFRSQKFIVLNFVLGTIIYLMFFYTYFKNPYVIKYLENVVLYKKIICDFSNILLFKKLFFNFLFPFVRFIIIFFPFIVFLTISIFSVKNHKTEKMIFPLAIFIFLLMLSGSIMAASTSGMLDNNQLLYNLLPFTITAIWGFFVVLLSFPNKMSLVFTFLLCVFIANFYHSYPLLISGTENNQHSASFRKECIFELEKYNTRQIVGYSLSDKNYSVGVLESIYKTPCFFLNLNSNGVNLVDINTSRFKLFSDTSDYVLGKNDMKYFEQKFEKGTPENIIQTEFIRHYNIKFLYFRNGSVISPKFLNGLKIIKHFKDKITGDEFLVIRPIK
jgi:hypothetical protein